MENTILNKEKFFALYWGQEVGQKEGNVMGIDYKIDWSNMRTIVDKEYLKLKSLSEISDEDEAYMNKIMDLPKGVWIDLDEKGNPISKEEADANFKKHLSKFKPIKT